MRAGIREISAAEVLQSMCLIDICACKAMT